MKAQRPYLFDAIYRWVLDNNMSPYLLVKVDDSTTVPMDSVEEGRIVLNITPSAVAHFVQDEVGIAFSARFGGKSQQVIVPFSAMAALYAKENAQGIVFPQEEIFTQADVVKKEDESIEESSDKDDKDKKKSHLKVIK